MCLAVEGSDLLRADSADHTVEACINIELRNSAKYLLTTH